MHLGDVHLNRISIDHLEREFLQELERLIAMHRYLVTTARQAIYESYEQVAAEHGSNPDRDLGDVMYEVDREFGFDPSAVDAYAGSATLVRAVALVEIVLARFAATCWARPDLTVFPKGNVWWRDWAVAFYKTSLVEPFEIDGNGFRALQGLRDAITHGYGVPVTEQAQQDLARGLYRWFDTGPITDEERELGYHGEASFFGDNATYDAATGLTSRLLHGVPAASPTPLATYRALRALGPHVQAAAEAVRGGLCDVEGTKFAKKVRAFWEAGGKRTRECPESPT